MVVAATKVKVHSFRPYMQLLTDKFSFGIKYRIPSLPAEIADSLTVLFHWNYIRYTGGSVMVLPVWRKSRAFVGQWHLSNWRPWNLMRWKKKLDGVKRRHEYCWKECVSFLKNVHKFTFIIIVHYFFISDLNCLYQETIRYYLHELLHHLNYL